MLLKEGALFSGCKILSLCGKGAFGITYLAQTPLDEKIIVKIVASATGAEKELKGVKNYMQIAGTHPNLLKIFHTGITDEGFFYTMEAADDIGSGNEYVPATLSNLLKRYRSFTPEEAIRIIRELLEAVKIMHTAGLIHRDIKPENIIFVNGKPKLSDPGLVTVVDQTVSLAGTFGFIPPECFDGSVPVGRTGDLYALGMCFYCMVTGFRPKDYPRLPLDMRIEVCRQLAPALHLMCNRNPEKRFQSAEEFLKGLPEKLENPTRFEEFRENFRQWKGMHRRELRIFTFVLIFAGLLVCTGTGGFLHYQRKCRLQREQWQKTVDTFNQTDAPRRSLLEFQMKHSFPVLFERYASLKNSLEESLKKRDLKTAAEKSTALKKLLSDAAAKETVRLSSGLPDPEKRQEGFAAAGAFNGFITSPLAVFAPPELLEEAQKKISPLERKLYADYYGPRCSGEWTSPQDRYANMVFMAPGVVRLGKSQKIVKIPYHYWIGKYEVTGEAVGSLLNRSPRRSALPQTPVERISWNDCLYYCRAIYGKMKARNVLPPGYIVRPPTEAEWVFASQNGWLGPDTDPLEKRAVIKSNSQNRTHPAGSRLPNRSGIYDMFGNVAEIVIPDEKHPQNLWLGAMGGSFKSKPERCGEKVGFLAYQVILDDIGLRLVIAPGDESFYDRYFFNGASGQFRRNGKVFELTGGLTGAFDRKQAQEFARLMGGQLAEFDNKEEMTAVSEAFLLLTSWPAHTGLMKINGKWQFPRNGKGVDYGRWRRMASSKNAPYGALWNKQWCAVEKVKLPLFLCQWNEKEYEKRNAHLDTMKKLPLELTRFTDGDREFILINSNIHWYGARRVCELLGGRLAVLESETLRRKAIEKLKNFSGNIILGGYAKWDKWYWLDGTSFEMPLKNHLSSPGPSLNSLFLSLDSGTFYASVFSTAFLLERRQSSASSRVR